MKNGKSSDYLIQIACKKLLTFEEETWMHIEVKIITW